MAISGWVPGWIVDLVTTGREISDELDDTFGNIDTEAQGVRDGTVPLTKLKLTPQVSPPAFVPGTAFACGDENTLAFYTDISGFMVHSGIDTMIRVINKTGVTIPAGKAIRNGGIDVTTGQIKAVLAKADLLVTSFVIGLTATELLPDAEGFVIDHGHVHDIDTLSPGLVLGAPIFLSDTVAGGLTNTQPDIASTLGTVQVISATAGEIFVKIDNLIAYPQATGYLRGQNVPAYSLTTTAQDINDFILYEDIIMTVDPSLGTLTVPLDGIYHIAFTAVTSFASTTSTRTVYFELYNITTATVEGAYPRNIPRDATEEGVSFTAPFRAIAGHVYKMRVRASTTMTINFDNAAFMMTSNHLG